VQDFVGQRIGKFDAAAAAEVAVLAVDDIRPAFEENVARVVLAGGGSPQTV
jgi:hypothetical protein